MVLFLLKNLKLALTVPDFVRPRYVSPEKDNLNPEYLQHDHHDIN